MTNKSKMLLCHFTVGELEGLDNLQGGPSIDPSTGVREYSRLATIIQIPEIRAVFHYVQNDLEADGKVSKKTNKAYRLSAKETMPYLETPAEKSSKDIKRLEDLGEGGDTKLAWIPYDLAAFLIELRNGPSINPHTGLLQFGLLKKVFKNVVKIAGSVGGALLGGPLGAGAGRAITGMLTGEKAGKAFRKGLSHTGRAAIVSGIGGGIAQLAPGLAGNIGSGATSLLGSNLANMGGQFFTGPLSTMGMLSSLGSGLGLTAGAGAGAAGAGAAGAAGTGAAGAAGAAKTFATPFGTLAAKGAASAAGAGNALSSLAVPALMGGMAYLGSQKKYKQDVKREQQAEERLNQHRNEMGFNKDWQPIKPKQNKINPDFYEQDPTLSKYGAFTAAPFLNEEQEGYAYGGRVNRRQNNLKSYKQGALVKGRGKGQDDLINTIVPEGSHIIDASTTSMFGDGSSSAGGNILKQFENLVKRSIPKKSYIEIEARTVSRSPRIPVRLSNDEYRFDPVTVAILGRGSNTKGSKMLTEMVENLRLHKISNGAGLPPKAKSPLHYMNMRG